MKLDQYTQTDRNLHNLIARARQWQNLDSQIKKLLPANLHPHMQAVCIENGVLIVHAHAPMAANRLKMLLPALLPQLQQLHPQLQSLTIKIRPKNPPVVAEKNFRISGQALQYFRQSAARLQHHPELAQALQHLADNHE